MLPAALFLVLLGPHGTAQAQNTVHLCNGSTTMKIHVALAWRSGYTSNYRSGGWYELEPAGNLMARPCTQLGVPGFFAPVYVAVTHADPSGRRSLYEYDIDTWGGIYKPTSQWICVNLSDRFSMNAPDGVEGLANCPAGMRSIPFDIQINPPDLGKDTVLYVAEPGNKGTFVATIDELRQGMTASIAMHPDGGTNWAISAGSVAFRYSDAAAVAHCEKTAKRPGCSIVARTRGKCVAIAMSRTKKDISYSISDSKDDAIRTALAQCNKAHGDCAPRYDKCLQ